MASRDSSNEEQQGAELMGALEAGGESHQPVAGGILWLTNVAPPYRIPVWQDLRRTHRLRLLLCSRDEPNRNWADYAREADAEVLELPFVEVAGQRWYLPTPRFLRTIWTTPHECVVVDGWDSPAYWCAIIMARQRRQRLVLLYRSTHKSQRHRFGPIALWRTLLMRRADFVITGGSDSTETVGGMGVSRHRIRQVFNAADVSWFRDTVSDIRDRSDPRVGAGHHFVYVGQLIDRKNLEALIGAFELVAQPGDVLSIIGDGPLASRLQGIAQRYAANGGPGSIALLGQLRPEQVAEALARAHTLALVSREEVWGLVVNEALASGLHVVVSNRCGVWADVRAMAGVFTCGLEPESIAEALDASRSSWTGWLAEPSILAWSPKDMARVVTECSDTSL